MKNSTPLLKHLLSIPVIVAALGYFVDIYDLVLFGIVRVPSLKALGLLDAQILDKGVFLLNMQMIGMLIGGVIWGILGDKKGRLQILFGSILLYSIANIANGFVTNVDQYAVCRFLAGIGLAGELGAGITLVAEILPKEIRGYGTMMVATIGVSGAVVAYAIAEDFMWRTSYFIGGGLGFLLLILRVSVYESGMFEAIKKTNISRGNFLSLFTKKDLFNRYLKCILIGLPSWYVVGVLITFSPELGKALNLAEPIAAGQAIMFCYIGLILGDLSSGILSQLLQSRKKVVFIFLMMAMVIITFYFSFLQGGSAFLFYSVATALGFSIGYWAVFLTIAAEQFGTNLRATVTTTVPNFVRGATVPITLMFNFGKGYLGVVNSAILVGVLVFAISLYAVYKLNETFHKSLDFVEVN
ncbi:MAG: MFS transporter [Ignavibacteriaceae bacterium]|nr:MFS transporter [Ignavibacteriaceae bacterium]